MRSELGQAYFLYTPEKNSSKKPKPKTASTFLEWQKLRNEPYFSEPGNKPELGAQNRKKIEKAFEVCKYQYKLVWGFIIDDDKWITSMKSCQVHYERNESRIIQV